MIKNLDEDQKQQALSMGLFMAGAAMMDPRGTGGSFGAALNNGVRAGFNTAIPMMQWMQQTNTEDEDRKYRKKQDRLANRFRQNAQVLQEMQFKAQESYRNKTLGLQERRMQMELDKNKSASQAVSQFMDMATQGVPNPEFAANPPPMAINPATNQPFGMPNVSQRVPMSPQQFAAGSAMLSAGHDIPTGAFTPMQKAMFPEPDLNSMVTRATQGDPQAIQWLETRKKYAGSPLDPIAEIMARQMQGMGAPR